MTGARLRICYNPPQPIRSYFDRFGEKQMSEVVDPSTPSPGGNWRRGFWSLIGTQFQVAFNDNGLKNLVIFIILGMGLSELQRQRLVLEVGVLFSLPYILFSMTGGYLADRYSKRAVTIGTKVFELAALLVAIAGLTLQNISIELAAVFLTSTQAAFFGPSKYGMLPELLPQERLSWGNGVLELGTFIALIAGTVAGATMSSVFAGRQAWSGIILLAFSGVGLLCSLGINRLPAANPAKPFRANVVGDLIDQCRLIAAQRVLWLAVLGNTYFWFLAALLQFNIVFYGNDVLKASSTSNGLLQAAVAIGIGVGSLAAGYLSGNKIEYGLIPLGAIGMTVFGMILSANGLTFVTVMLLLAGLGFSGGFFIVPINALIQHCPDDRQKGSVIAAANLLSFVGVFASSAAYFALTRYMALGPAAIFLAISITTIAATIYVIYLLPDSLLRLILWAATHSVYRIHVEGRENIPAKGGAMLVPNHVSMADAVLLIASTDRFIRFIMFKDAYEHPLIKPFAKIMGVIPISSQQRPREMIHSLRAATQAVKDGEVVCIFPEGSMTRTGQMLPFRRGLERIMKDVDAPIIPASIDGIWGSIFSFDRGRYVWKMPRHIPYPVSVTFGKPMPSSIASQEARRAVQELGTQAFAHRKPYMHTLHRSFIITARHHPFRFAMADGLVPRINFMELLARTVFLARRLRNDWRGQDKVGILLPPSVSGAMVNLAALMMGKVPVNLNYTASNEVVRSCAEQCGLQTVITAKAFLERIHVQPPVRAVMLEDAAANPSLVEKIVAGLIAWFFPMGWLEQAAGSERRAGLDDVAAIIFSSGSTGDPKGVVLSHYNVASNVEQLNQVFMLGSGDRILGILPFFHSFGFMGALCLPTAIGMGVVYHPNPLDAKSIGALVSKYAVTFLLSTPTFLQTYMRRCAPEDFGSLKYVLAGAEKLSDRVALDFEDYFGIRPLEGYGCTECSPVVAVNTRDFREAAFRQVGAKRGSIGHPLPGISVKLMDSETFNSVPINKPGLLLVKGPNVMQGYLNRPEKTSEVLRDGWYDTGDIAMQDEDGFIWITDRLSRFSKIGGEMVPHIKVEEKLHELADASQPVFAVTSVPDDRKGERLIVLHTLTEAKLQECLAKLAASGLPALWRPRPDQFLHVDALPYLGTGKADLRQIREIALKSSGQLNVKE